MGAQKLCPRRANQQATEPALQQAVLEQQRLVEQLRGKMVDAPTERADMGETRRGRDGFARQSSALRGRLAFAQTSATHILALNSRNLALHHELQESRHQAPIALQELRDETSDDRMSFIMCITFQAHQDAGRAAHHDNGDGILYW